MSIVLFLLAGCEAHLGVIPPTGAWSVGEVRAPVPEADIDRWVRDAVTDALSARAALDPAGPALAVTIVQASWTPARRSADTLLYDATLVLTLSAGDRTVTRTRVRSVVDPGNAADARGLREDTFRALSRQLADEAVAAFAAAP